MRCSVNRRIAYDNVAQKICDDLQILTAQVRGKPTGHFGNRQHLLIRERDRCIHLHSFKQRI
jgi:hypothetical protein